MVNKKNTAKSTKTVQKTAQAKKTAKAAKPLKNAQPATSKASHITTSQTVKNVQSSIANVRNSMSAPKTPSPPQSLITQGWNDLGLGGKVSQVKQSQSASTQLNFEKAACIVFRDKADIENAIFAGAFTSLEDNMVMSQIETWGPMLKNIGIDTSGIPRMWDQAKLQIEINHENQLQAYFAGRTVIDGASVIAGAAGIYAGTMAIKAGVTGAAASGGIVSTGAGVPVGAFGYVISGGAILVGVAVEGVSAPMFASGVDNFGKDFAQLSRKAAGESSSGGTDSAGNRNVNIPRNVERQARKLKIGRAHV